MRFVGLLLRVAGMVLTFHALSRARRLPTSDREIVLDGMREIAKGPFGRWPVRWPVPRLRGPGGVILELIYGVGGIFAGFGGLFFWPS
jgi:hypothetical protein